MDTLFLMILLSTNPVVKEFTVNFEIDSLIEGISSENILGYSKSQFLHLKNSYIILDDKNVYGDLFLSSSKLKTKHMVYFKTYEDVIWKKLKDFIVEKSSFSQDMQKNPFANLKDGERSTYYAISPLTIKGFIYKISIIHKADDLLNNHETQIFMKIATANTTFP